MDRQLPLREARRAGPGGAGLALILAGCAPEPERTCPCDRFALPAAPVTTHDGVVALLAEVRGATWPELDGVEIGVAPVEDLRYFRAWVELETFAEDDGRARTYTVQYDPVVLAEPMTPAALAATFVHELAHVHDYVGMDAETLADFALWYATEDPHTSEDLAAYERATDHAALARGCGTGLAESMTWIYAQSADDPELLAEKLHNYDTPLDIARWTTTHGSCTVW